MSYLAVLCVRNEQVYIARTLEHLRAHGFEIVVIDNESDDDTPAIVRSYLGRGVCELRTLAFAGAYTLSDQLRAKEQVVRDFAPDWALHLDADERPDGGEAGVTLREELERAARDGFTCVNFDEFVFVPAVGEDHEREDFVRAMRRYYFFEPRPLRLMRAWRPAAGVVGLRGGGHLAEGAGLRVMPRNLPLRHYIVLGQAHARRKYLNRRYAESCITRGWHGNRLAITEANLRLPAATALKELPDWRSYAFERDDPQRRHFWQW